MSTCWSERPGRRTTGHRPPGWTPHSIGTPPGSSPFGVSAVAAGDFDGDGDLDVAYFVRPWVCGSACGEPGAVTWFESDGPSPPAWTQIATLETDILCFTGYLSRLYPEDFDGDGDLDLVVSCYRQNFVFGETRWYENDGASPPSFTERAPEIYGGGTPFDLDRDGDLDLLVNGNDGFGNESVAWHESDGAQPPGLALHVVDGPTLLPTAHAPFDVDLDGDLDLVLTDRDELVWYENLTEPVPALPGALRALLPALLLAAAWQLRRRAAGP